MQGLKDIEEQGTKEKEGSVPPYWNWSFFSDFCSHKNMKNRFLDFLKRLFSKRLLLYYSFSTVKGKLYACYVTSALREPNKS
jgi:hypothetical protein